VAPENIDGDPVGSGARLMLQDSISHIFWKKKDGKLRAVFDEPAGILSCRN
jgi:hypothetical protein